jgi:glutathione S-transferase
MKLYVTPTSPYARLMLIVRREKGLEDRVEVVHTRTRNPDDPLLTVNPSGRIPFLLLPDGSGFEDTEVLVDYFDALSPPRQFAVPTGVEYWPFRRILAMARSFIDGGSVWGREIIRPEIEQSPMIIDHEKRRAERLAAFFESSVVDPPLTEPGPDQPLNMPQLLLFCALDLERRVPEFHWRNSCVQLVTWFDRIRCRPSVEQAFADAESPRQI